MIACVDNPPDWRNLLGRAATKRVVEDYAAQPAQFREFLSRFDSGDTLFEPASKVRAEITSIRERVTHLRVFHGCAIRNYSDYTTCGIVRSDIESLTKLAHDLFGSSSDVDRCIAALGREYVAHNHGKVFFTYSLQFALSSESSHTSGSEFLRSIASRLGQAGRTRFEKARGAPALLEVKLPSEWVKSTDLQRLLELSFLQWCASMSGDSLPSTYLGGGFSIERDVPADLITNVYFPKD